MLRTIESCQGRAKAGAWVCFAYGPDSDQPWRQLAEFVLGYLGPGLAKAVGDRARLSLCVRPSGQTLGELEVRAGAVDQVATALTSLAADQDRP